jgi:hypothetical protein
MVRDQNIIVGRNQVLDSKSEKRSRVVVSLHAMLRFFEPGLNIGLMLHQICLMVETYIPSINQIVKFSVLIGLRPAEKIQSIRLVNAKIYPFQNFMNLTKCYYSSTKCLLSLTKNVFEFFVMKCLNVYRI